MRNSNTLGLMIEIEGSIDAEGYKTSLRAGVARACKDLNFNLICFGGGALARSPYHYSEKERNTIYRLMTKNTLDGLIIVSTTLAYAEQEEKSEFLSLVRDIPTLIVGPKQADFPHISVDNEYGLKIALTHLIQKHNKRKIAFIKGPAGNPETEIRYNVYLNTLNEFNIPFNPKMVTEGNFLMQSGCTAVKTLLDDNLADIDAIVASNDNMAFGALQELHNRGISVPGTLSLIGFDDTIKAKTAVPSLTTVRQPVFGLGYKSVEYIKSLIEKCGNNTGEKMPAELIIRQSCGCVDNLGFIPDQLSNLSVQENYALITSHKAEIHNEILKTIRANRISHDTLIEWTTKLLDSLIGDLKTEDTTDSLYITSLNQIIMKVEDNISHIQLTGSLVELLYKAVNRFIQNRDFSYKNNGLFLKAQLLIGNMEKNIDISNQMHSEMQIEVLYQLSQTIFSENNLDSIFRVLSKGLERLKINNCFILLTDPCSQSDINAKQYDHARLVYSFKDMPVSDENNRGMNRSGNSFQFILSYVNNYCIVLPLFMRDKQLGLLIVEPGPQESMVYETLRSQISQAIYNSYLITEKEIAADNLKKAFIELTQRNVEMEHDIQMARQIQNQLMPSKSPRNAISFWYKPMQSVGGDFFDFLEFPKNDNLGIFMSDVSGHGVQAAFITSMIKSALQQRDMAEDNPAHLLQDINECLYNQISGFFVTAFFGIYLFESRQFIFANAGHNAPLYIRQGTVTPIQTSNIGIPLGILSNQEMLASKKVFTCKSVQLEAGSKLILYTDGLTDTTAVDNQNLDFKNAMLDQTFLEFSHLPSGEFISETVKRLVQFHGSENFNDDVCILCLDV